MTDRFDVERLGVLSNGEDVIIEDSTQVVDEGLFLVHEAQLFIEPRTTAERWSVISALICKARVQVVDFNLRTRSGA